MKINIFFIIILTTGFCISCGRKTDHPQLVEKLQKHVDNLTEQGYQIDRITLYSKSFKDHGSKASDQMEFLFICAVPPDSTIQYMANFSVLDVASADELTFHGYPIDSNNRRKNKVYTASPRFREALSKLDEIKKLIPEHYKYKHLLQLEYLVEADGRPVYEFRIEVKPDSEDATHPKVRKENLSHVTILRPPQKRKFGYREPKRKVEKKVQHSITFRLTDNQIMLKSLNH